MGTLQLSVLPLISTGEGAELTLVPRAWVIWLVCSPQVDTEEAIGKL